MQSLTGVSPRTAWPSRHILFIAWLAFIMGAPVGSSSALAQGGGVPWGGTVTERWVILPCRFADVPDEPLTRERMREIVSPDNGLQHYWSEVSYGRYIVETDVAAWHQLPLPRSGYGMGAPSPDTSKLIQDCISASNADVDFSGIDGVHVVANAFIGGFASAGTNSIPWVPLNVDGPSRVVKGVFYYAMPSLGGMVHEMGHALGFPGHPEYERAGGGPSGSAQGLDPLNGCAACHLSGVRKEIFGWLDGRRLVLPAGRTQTITLHSTALPPAGGLLAAIIPDGNAGYFLVESRWPRGHDGVLAGAGVAIFRVTTSVEPVAIRYVTRPGDTSITGSLWQAGDTFTDPASGVSIRVESAGVNSHVVTLSGAAAPPTNTSCETATVLVTPTASLPGGVAQFGQIVRTDGLPVNPAVPDSACGVPGRTLWYRYTADRPADAILSVKVNNPRATVTAWYGACGRMGAVAPTPCGTAPSDSAEVFLQAGETVFFAVRVADDAHAVGVRFLVGPNTETSCATALAANPAVVPASGGGGVLTVTAPASCVWGVFDDASWFQVPAVQLPSGISTGTHGTASHAFTVATNTGPGRAVRIRTGGGPSAFLTQEGCAMGDDDCDGLPTLWERSAGLDPLSALGAHGSGGDLDGDGVTNAQELLAGTHPNSTSLPAGSVEVSSGDPTASLVTSAGGVDVSFSDVWRLGSLNAVVEADDPSTQQPPPAGVLLLPDRTFELNTTTLFSEATVCLPYDPAVAAAAGLDENALRLYHRPAGAGPWVDVTTRVDTTTRQVCGSVSNFSPFAIGGADPKGPVMHTRYLAEGATSSFFDTQIALLNPGSETATATLRFLRGGQAPIAHPVVLQPRRRVTINPKAIAGLQTAEFSTVVESDQPLVVDRTMTWDSTGFGAHSETAVVSPAPKWYLAEGATIAGFQLFYLLQNPSDHDVPVRVRYLRATGAPLEKTYALPAQSRFNIWANAEDFPGLGKALASAEFSAVVETLDATPIIVERAMYLSNQGRTFNAGHGSAGVTNPSTTWFLAEGATGPYFDLFVLIANPTDTDAQVKLTYLLDGGQTYTRTMTAPANARSGVYVDAEQFPGIAGSPLANVAVSTTVESLNGVPLVVERAMWWPGDGSTWHEAHNSAGATTTGVRWGVAEGEVGGPRGVETYLLIANTSSHEGSARVTLYFEDGTPPVTRTYVLPAQSRTNVNALADFGALVQNKRFGTVVESLGETPAQIVVERAQYSNAGGVRWAGGTNAVATKLQ